MYLPEAFSDFIEKIRLDKTRQGRVQSAHNAVRDALASIDEVNSRMTATYLQGSYALHTTVRPVNGEVKYDVDVVLAADFTDSDGSRWSPARVLEWLQSHVESISRYEGKTRLKTCCVCIDYAGDLHLDVVPAHLPGPADGSIYVPCWGYILGEWKESDPRGYIRWFEDHKRDSDLLLNLVRLAKYWRNLQGETPNSMVLTTLVTQHAPAEAPSLGAAFAQTLRSIAEWMDSETGLLASFSVSNPTLDDEDLAREWDDFDRSDFYDALILAADRADEALECKDEEETIGLWNHADLFDGQFPKKVRGLASEADSMAHELSSGAASVGIGGQIKRDEDRGGDYAPSNGGFFGA